MEVLNPRKVTIFLSFGLSCFSLFSLKSRVCVSVFVPEILCQFLGKLCRGLLLYGALSLTSAMSMAGTLCPDIWHCIWSPFIAPTVSPRVPIFYAGCY